MRSAKGSGIFELMNFVNMGRFWQQILLSQWPLAEIQFRLAEHVPQRDLLICMFTRSILRVSEQSMIWFVVWNVDAIRGGARGRQGRAPAPLTSLKNSIIYTHVELSYARHRIGKTKKLFLYTNCKFQLIKSRETTKFHNIFIVFLFLIEMDL